MAVSDKLKKRLNALRRMAADKSSPNEAKIAQKKYEALLKKHGLQVKEKKKEPPKSHSNTYKRSTTSATRHVKKSCIKCGRTLYRKVGDTNSTCSWCAIADNVHSGTSNSSHSKSSNEWHHCNCSRCGRRTFDSVSNTRPLCTLCQNHDRVRKETVKVRCHICNVPLLKSHPLSTTHICNSCYTRIYRKEKIYYECYVCGDDTEHYGGKCTKCSERYDGKKKEEPVKPDVKTSRSGSILKALAVTGTLIGYLCFYYVSIF